MTREQFQTAHAEKVNEFFMSPAGQGLMTILSAMRPVSEPSPHIHLYARSEGKKEGWEGCLRAAVALSFTPKVAPEPQADYGVPEPKIESK